MFFAYGIVVTCQLVGHSVFVDSVYGNDSSCTISNLDLPCRTITTGITKAQAQIPNPGSIWHVYAASGTYVENVVIPDSVYLSGSGPDTFIIGTITHTGGTLVTNVLIVSTNAPGIIVNSTQDVNYLTSVVSTTYTSPSTTPISTVQVLAGEFGFTDGAMFSTYKSTAPTAYLIYAPGGGLVFDNAELRLTVKGDIPSVIFYSFGPVDKAEWAIGVSALTVTQSVDTVVMFENNGLNNASVLANRISIAGNTINSYAIYQIANLTGGAELELSGCIIQADGIGDSTFNLAQGNPSGGVSPTFGINAGSFVDNFIPPTVGIFQQTRITSVDAYGSSKLGGLYSNIVTVYGNYTVGYSDFTVLVSSSTINTVITLPNYANSKGRIVYIRNISEFVPIQITGSIFRGYSTSYGMIITRGQTLMLQNDGYYWQVLLTSFGI